MARTTEMLKEKKREEEKRKKNSVLTFTITKNQQEEMGITPEGWRAAMDIAKTLDQLATPIKPIKPKKK